MSFNREFLGNLNLDDKQIDLIMNEHGKTLNEFKGQKAELAETKSNLAQAQSNNDDLQQKFETAMAKIEELSKAYDAISEQQVNFKKQREHDEAVTNSLGTLKNDKRWNIELLKKVFSNAEIENGQIKNLQEQLDIYKNIYKPQLKGGFNFYEGTDNSQNTAKELIEITQEEFDMHKNDLKWLDKNLDALEKAAREGKIHD